MDETRRNTAYCSRLPIFSERLFIYPSIITRPLYCIHMKRVQYSGVYISQSVRGVGIKLKKAGCYLTLNNIFRTIPEPALVEQQTDNDLSKQGERRRLEKSDAAGDLGADKAQPAACDDRTRTVYRNHPRITRFAHV